MDISNLWKQTNCLIFCLFSMILVSSHGNAAGYRVMTHNDLQVHVWYPTDHPAVPGRLGPFDVEQAVDAPLRLGRYPVILMSHGFNGRVRNHHLTAQALADKGSIVIVPMHAADFYIDTNRRAASLLWRVTELRQAIETVMQNDEFRPTLDLSSVLGIGYSLGTLTMMMAAGTGFDLSLIASHCTKEDDPNFCELQGIVSRWLTRRARGIAVHKPDRNVASHFFLAPLINGRIALIAPIGQGLLVDEGVFSATDVFVLGFANDEINLANFHTVPYRQMIPDGKLRHYIINDAGSHAAFIALFAKRVTDIEQIDVAIDPPGFDRRAFLDDLNARLFGFFLVQ